MGQDCLPADYGLIDQGKIRIGNRIAAEQVAQLKVPGYPHDFPPPEGQEEVLTNIEEPGVLIGRDREAREILQALVVRRLVTLTGPAGVGKSCLASWVGYNQAGSYSDGAWKIDLASLPRGGNVATAVAAVLQLGSGAGRAMDRVQRSLTSMDGILVLDNCEHLIEECRSFLVPILRQCPKLRFILGSRDELGLEDEYVIRLNPLEIPAGTDDVEHSEAVRLFLDRARKAHDKFSIRPSDFATIAAICQRVGALPLGIELAASQVATQSLEEILDSLTLEGPRPQYKLASAIASSYSLLDSEEQGFFRRCGVLFGTTNRELITAVGAAEGMSQSRAREILDRLVSASLVQVSGLPHALRYRLLEPLREFAMKLLKDGGELLEAEMKFARECKKWVIEWKGLATSNRQRDHHLRRESANLHAAIEHFLKDGRAPRDAFDFCLTLGDFWLLNGPYDQCANWFERAIALYEGPENLELGRAYNALGLLAGYAGEYGKSKRAYQRAIPIFEALGDRYYHSGAIQNLALTCRNDNQMYRSVVYARQALELVPEGQPFARMVALGNLAAYLVLTGETEEAKERVCEAMQMNEDIQDKLSLAGQHSILSQIHEQEFRLMRARQECRLSIPLFWEGGDVQGLLCAIEREGRLRNFTQEFERAAVLIGGTMRHFDRRGVGRPEYDVNKRDLALQQVREALGDEDTEAFMNYGSQRELGELYFLSIENTTPHGY